MPLLCRMGVLRTLILACLLFSEWSGAFAQQHDFNFINFSNKDGLSSNLVNVILKDKHGYMWFGTEDGLNKFDGSNFTVYRFRQGDSTSIGGNAILALCEDKEGNLWIGTDQSLSYYNRKKDAFVNYEFAKNSTVQSLAIDHLGNVWVGTYYGLYKYNHQKGVLKHYLADKQKPGQLKSNAIISVFEDSQNRLWLGTSAGVHLYDWKKDRFINFEHSESDTNSIAGNWVQAIAESVDGSLWFGTNAGLSRLLPGRNHFRNYYRTNDNNSLICNEVGVVAPDHKGRVWVGTQKGVNIIDPHTDQIITIKSDHRNKYSLTGKSVKSIYADSNDIYWIGTYQGGVNKYDENLAFFNLRQGNLLDPTGLTNPMVTSFVETPSGDLFIGTDGGGLNFYSRKTGVFNNTSLIRGMQGKASTILAMERVGNELWIGTYGEGLYILNMVTRVVTQHVRGEGIKHLSSNAIFCIKRDSEGKIWIGTNGNGVNVFDPSIGGFLKLDSVRITTGEKLLADGYIRAIEEDKKGNIWIGSQGSGIVVYDRASKRFRMMNQINSNLPSRNVYSIYADKDGNIWAGTSNEGLCLLEKGKSTFVSYSEKQGLSNALVYKILEDDDNKIWLSTNKGISSFDKKERKFKNYSFQNGLQHSTFCLGAGIKTSTGELFFGGLEGFNFFNPKNLKSNKKTPALVFTDLKISNRSIAPGETSAIREHISIAKEIYLDYKQNFSLDFVALNYTSPSENRYAYKLEGFDKEWVDMGAGHTAVYTNLDPGTYVFRVKAKSDDGLWSTSERTITIFVKPPFWRTIYAYVFYLLAAIAFVALIRYRGMRKLKNKFAMEQERIQFQRMIEEEKRERERQHEFDLQRIKFLTNLSHEFRTPISLIMGPVDKMIGNEVNREKLEHLGLIKRNTRRLLNLVNQLLDFRKLEQNELNLNLAGGDIVGFVGELVESFKDMAEYREIDFSFSSALPHYYTEFDHDKIERICFNLLSNAFKFTEKGGKISLRIDQAEDAQLMLHISDTGIGMSEEEKEKIFERFYQCKVKADILNQGSGIGLSITNEFVKLHGGTIEVESKQGEGSAFTILLPLKPVDDTSNQPHIVVNETRCITNTDLQKALEIVPGPEKATVLIIEDNDDFRNYLRDNLKLYYKIVEATNGKEGWQKALSSHPKVIVSDISMPGMDGITLSRKLKSDKRTRHIPIILLTAITGDANQLKGLQSGASDYLTKPFNFDILQLKINNLLALNQSLENTYTKQLKVVTPDVKVESQDEQLLLKVSQYIEEHIDSPDLSVEELSKHLYISRSTLYSKIVSLTGETPVEFIRSIKLKKAVGLLENSDLKIAEIAYMVGFSTPNYFARAFKAKYNVSPTEYVSLKRGTVDSGLRAKTHTV